MLLGQLWKNKGSGIRFLSTLIFLSVHFHAFMAPKYKIYCLYKMKKAFHSMKGTSVSAFCLLLKIVGWLFFGRK